jgi:hypothetical protein
MADVRVPVALVTLADWPLERGAGPPYVQAAGEPDAKQLCTARRPLAERLSSTHAPLAPGPTVVFALS